MSAGKVPTIEDLEKQGLLMRGDDERLRVRRLPLGIPALDAMLGGGVPIGRILLAYGPESTGKTLVAQYIVAAAQKQDPEGVALLMDMERSYDKEWWAGSGVDVERLLVSDPATAEQAIDIMRRMLEVTPKLSVIVLDSIASMTPGSEADLEVSTEQRNIGLLALLVTKMFRQVLPLIKRDTIFVITNQMRDTIGSHEELAGLPGGRSQRHFAHIILRTKRESWIMDAANKQRIGFNMELTVRKNKTAPIQPGVILPFRFHGQIDLLSSYLEDGVQRGLIEQAGPYFKWQGKSFLGRNNLRQHFLENVSEYEFLKAQFEAPASV